MLQKTPTPPPAISNDDLVALAKRSHALASSTVYGLCPNHYRSAMIAYVDCLNALRLQFRTKKPKHELIERYTTRLRDIIEEMPDMEEATSYLPANFRFSPSR